MLEQNTVEKYCIDLGLNFNSGRFLYPLGEGLCANSIFNYLDRQLCLSSHEMGVNIKDFELDVKAYNWVFIAMDKFFDLDYGQVLRSRFRYARPRTAYQQSEGG